MISQENHGLFKGFLTHLDGDFWWDSIQSLPRLQPLLTPKVRNPADQKCGISQWCHLPWWILRMKWQMSDFHWCSSNLTKFTEKMNLLVYICYQRLNLRLHLSIFVDSLHIGSLPRPFLMTPQRGAETGPLEATNGDSDAARSCSAKWRSVILSMT